MEIEFPNMEPNPLDAYPIWYIHIDRLIHKRTDLHLVKSEIQCRQNEIVQEWYLWIEKILPDMERGLFNKEDPHPAHPFGDVVESILRNQIFYTYQHIKKHRKMLNPIIVLFESDQEFYIVRGSQRICVLRALGFDGCVPCRVLLSGEDLSTDGNPAFLAHPYVEVPEYMELQKGKVLIKSKPGVKFALVLKSGYFVKNLIPEVENVMDEIEYRMIRDQIPESEYTIKRIV